MAQLKDTVISGNLRVTDTIYGHNPHHVYHVIGTQTASTNAWKGDLPEVDALYEGLIIDYWLPFAGTSSSATLTLTLKDGTTTSALPVYRSGTTRMNNQIGANNFLHLVYQTITISGTSYTGWWMHADANANTTDIVNLYQGSGAYQANSAVYRYQLLFLMDENVLTPLNNANNVTATTKTMLTDVEFNPFGYIFYYNSTTTVSANGNMTTTLYYQRNGVDLRYTFNCGQTLTAHKYLYIKLSLQSNGKVKIADASPWTHTLPSTNDGYLYLLLGRTYSTYQFALFKEHPIYYHDGTSLRQYIRPDLATTSFPGLMSASDKSKLNNIAENANNYILPVATTTTIGGLTDAPSDSKQYTRKNGSWEEVKYGYDEITFTSTTTGTNYNWNNNSIVFDRTDLNYIPIYILNETTGNTLAATFTISTSTITYAADEKFSGTLFVMRKNN